MSAGICAWPESWISGPGSRKRRGEVACVEEVVDQPRSYRSGSALLLVSLSETMSVDFLVAMAPEGPSRSMAASFTSVTETSMPLMVRTCPCGASSGLAQAEAQSSEATSAAFMTAGRAELFRFMGVSRWVRTKIRLGICGARECQKLGRSRGLPVSGHEVAAPSGNEAVGRSTRSVPPFRPDAVDLLRGRPSRCRHRAGRRGG